MQQSRPIFTASPALPSCHAPTIVEAASGRFLAAWFAGTHEGHPDVAIWLSRYDRSGWSVPERIASIEGVPLWNPVLFRDAAGAIWLFYKAGPAVPAWTGLHSESYDCGATWTPPAMLAAGITGPAKNKPLTLSNGDILCGASVETWRSWAAWVEISRDGGRTWSRHGPITVPPDLGRWRDEGGLLGSGSDPALVSATWDATAGRLRLPQDHLGVIQPAVWEYAPGRVRMLLRATRAVGSVCIAESCDFGRTWSLAQPTTVPHSNSGLDAVRLADGRIVLACNPTHEGRSPLSLLISADNGASWPQRLDLETAPGEFSYPSIIQAADGRLHLVYTDRRVRIQHTVLDLDELT